MITNEDIWRIAMQQPSYDCSCLPEDFLAERNVATISKKHPLARKHLNLPLSCDLVSYGSNIVAQASGAMRCVRNAGIWIGATTLDIFSHVIDTMQLQAAAKIKRQIGKTDTQVPPDEQPKHTDQSGFQPYKSKYRKSGTGGKRIRRNVYAKTREECEEKLAKMIEEVKREIAEGKEKMAAQSMT